MIYCQLNPRLSLKAGEALRMDRLCRLLGPEKAGSITLDCPEAPGVWRIEAISAAQSLQAAFPEEQITLLGPDTCTVRRLPPEHPDRIKPLRTALGLSVLLLGSLLGMTWFHCDVNMPVAMASVYTLLTGQPLENRLLVTIPYAVGVALGAGVFYALGSKNAVTPLDVKFSDYRDDMERAEARDVE